MDKLVVVGASGIVGQEFVEQIVREGIYRNVVLLSSSDRGLISLKHRFGDIKNVRVESVNVNVINSGDIFDIVNLAYPSTGLPWERINAARKLAKQLICLSRRGKCRKFIEVGSQSVFGYEFKNDYTIHSNFPKLVPEYSITKQTMERLLWKGLQRSETKFIVVRLGNVITAKSAAFHKRLFQIVFDDSFNKYNYEGYMNACFLENVIAGLSHILLNAQPEDKKIIYHFSEITEYKWEDIFKIIICNNNLKIDFDNIYLQHQTKHKSLTSGKLQAAYFFLLHPMGFFTMPKYFNDRVVQIYRKYKLRNSRQNMYDGNLRCIFSEKYRFVNHYPASFSYVVEKKYHFKRLKEIFDLSDNI